jgi:hypothetical protein
MANAGSVTQVHQPNKYGPLPIQLWKATVTIPAAATGVTVTAPNKMSGTAVAAWIDPTTLTASATIKVYDATDALTTPTYVVDYTVPSPAVETHSALNARERVMGTLTCVVASATAADSFDLYVIVDPNADDAFDVALGDVSVDIDADTIALLNVHPTGLSTVAVGERQGSATAVQMPTVSAKFVRVKACVSNAGNVYLGGASVTKPNGTTDTTTGLELAPGDDTGWLPASNLNVFYIICDNATDDVTYMVLA